MRNVQKVLLRLYNYEVYLDDIVIYSASWEKHVKTFELVFK